MQTLLLLTTITTMYVAGDPSPRLVALVCLGGYLSAGGAGAVNHYWDRDIDARMSRTAGRPIPAGRDLAAAPRSRSASRCRHCRSSNCRSMANVLAASLALAGFVGYVGVYTIWLKRRTPQNIVIGGAAGAVPPLVAWAAVTGHLAPIAVYLFFIVFFWTPPHFWALSLLMSDEYAAVEIPMLPVVRGERETRKQIVLYSILLYAVTQLPFCAGRFGDVYLVVSMILGALFIGGAVLLYRRADRRAALRLYLFSLAYLALLFCAMAIDAHALGRYRRPAGRAPGGRSILPAHDDPSPRPQEPAHGADRRRPVDVHVRPDVHRRGHLHLMSPLDPEVPPVGEEIHLPGPSIIPFLTAVGITMIVVGLTTFIEVTIAGIILTVVCIGRWIMDMRRDIDELPLG